MGLTTLWEGPGRPLLIDADGTVYRSERHRVLRSSDWGVTWTLDAVVPAPPWRRVVGRARLGARAFRLHVSAFEVLPDGARVASVRGGVWRAGPGEVRMTRVFATDGAGPLQLGVASGRIAFGDYPANPERREVHVRVSDDGGRTFEVAHTLPAGTVRHVHAVLPDRDGWWLLAGDHGAEPGIGHLDHDLGHLEWVVRGDQHARAVSAIVEPDCLLYGTDTELEQNYVVRLDTRTGERERLRPVEGSSLYAGRLGPLRLVATCVEPSRVNLSSSASLYGSPDGQRWDPIETWRKDRWPGVLGFGAVVLPVSRHAGPRGAVGGQALAGFDDRTRLVAWQDG